MKKILPFLLLFSFLLTACGQSGPPAQVAATTLPVYDFTTRLCQGTGITVTRLITEQVSCLHDYSLNVRQVKAAKAAELVVISGAGLENFLGDILEGRPIVDASQGIDLLCSEEEHHDEEEHHHEGHHHDVDPHIWLSPLDAKIMAGNICEGLIGQYPEHADTFRENLTSLQADLDTLYDYGRGSLSDLRCRDLITFHDGFSYFASCFDLTIVEAVEEESGREASAQELIHLIRKTEEHNLPAIFTEKNGSVSAAQIISRETSCGVYCLDMAMSGDGCPGDSYFEAMYQNINTVREALQ